MYKYIVVFLCIYALCVRSNPCTSLPVTESVPSPNSWSIGTLSFRYLWMWLYRLSYNLVFISFFMLSRFSNIYWFKGTVKITFENLLKVFPLLYTIGIILPVEKSIKSTPLLNAFSSRVFNPFVILSIFFFCQRITVNTILNSSFLSTNKLSYSVHTNDDLWC